MCYIIRNIVVQWYENYIIARYVAIIHKCTHKLIKHQQHQLLGETPYAAHEHHVINKQLLHIHTERGARIPGTYDAS